MTAPETAPPTTVRITGTAHETLRDLAEQTGDSMQVILDDAIEEYRRNHVLQQANAGYAALRSDPDSWKDEQDERAAWDAALPDGLQDE